MLVKSPTYANIQDFQSGSPSEGHSQWKCRMCSDGGHIEVVSVPYVFRYLVAELAAMNIRVKIETS